MNDNRVNGMTGRILALALGAALLRPFCATVWAAEAAAWRRPVTVDYRNQPLADVLKDLEGRTGIPILFDEGTVRGADNVTYQGRDLEAGRVITRILRPRGLGIASWDRTPAQVVKRDPYDELKAKRESVFEFARKPVVTREGDRITVTFETRSFCDCTVAIEDLSGRMLRHLVSGLLGENAPDAFQWNSKNQSVVWDGKDDRGVYVDDKDGCVVRVSLGLKPRFEKNLLWSPHRRVSASAPLMAAGPEGVYVYEGLGVDHLRLFDHNGHYIRTLYPFARNQLPKIEGLERRDYPHGGAALPVKKGFQRATLLTSGTSAMEAYFTMIFGGEAATTLAVCGSRMALSYAFVNRLSTDGTSGGLPLKGAQVYRNPKDWNGILGPASSAFSPDGRFLYLTGYHFVANNYYTTGRSYHGVYRVEFEKNDPPTVFAGEMDEEKHGTENGRFRVPRSVACDAEGRVYVADYMNDRVQIFAPDGKHLRNVSTPKPAHVDIHRKTGELYVFSYPGFGIPNAFIREANNVKLWSLPTTVSRFRPFAELTPIETLPLPAGTLDQGSITQVGTPLSVALDSWVEPPRVWIVGLRHLVTAAETSMWGMNAMVGRMRDTWKDACVRILERRDGKWEEIRRFGDDAEKALLRVKPPDFSRQRLMVHPGTGKVYVAEDVGHAKSFWEILEIDPDTGAKKVVQLPFDAEDLCFDIDGNAYLRTDTIVVRYEFPNWREIPWDYGEEREGVAFCGHISGRSADVQGGLPLPGRRHGYFHQHGMAVSPKGNLVVSVTSSAKPEERKGGFSQHMGPVAAGKPYSPKMYPGRARNQETHVWDRHGKLLYEDVASGITCPNGVGLDAENHVYVWASATRAYGGKHWPNPMTGTLMKFRPGPGRILMKGGDLPLPENVQPKRDPEFVRMGNESATGWAEGPDWFFGTGGFFGWNPADAVRCDCWHARFAMDYFARSFVPELDVYSVAVLDNQGNVIVRVGQYGNADDGIPLARPDGGTWTAADNPAAVALGGDEVGLFHAAYVGTHSDRRLFIHDAGNSRVISVKLGYHTEEKTALKDVPDRPKP